jgi:tetratricopeptide (TPR) repeat protein
MAPIVFLGVTDDEWAKAEKDQKASASAFDVLNSPRRDDENKSRSTSVSQVAIAETRSVKDRKGKGKAVDLEPSTEWSNTNATPALEESGNPRNTTRGEDFAWAETDQERQDTVNVGWKPLISETEMKIEEFNLQEELKRWRREHGDHELTTLERMRYLATRYVDRGAFKEAEDISRETYKLAKETFHPDDPYTLNRLFELGFAVMLQGRIEDAIKIWDPFIETGKRVLLAASYSTSTIMGNAESKSSDKLLERLKSYIGHAEGLLRSISKIPPEHWSEGAERFLDRDTKADLIRVEDEDGFKDVEMGFGEYAETAAEIGAQAAVYAQQGQRKKAVQYLLFMLDMHEKVIGSEHEGTLAIMSKLAALYEKYMQWKEAEGLYARLAKLKRKTLGDRDPETLVAEIMHGRMIANQGFGRLEEMERIGSEVDGKLRPLLRSVTRLITMEEVLGNAKGSRLKQTSGLKPEFYSELVRTLGNWADHQRTAVATDTNEPSLNVYQPGQVMPPHHSGGVENPSETKSLEALVALEEVLRAERAAERGRPHLVVRFSDLSLEYESLYRRSGRIEALDGAIRNAEQAISILPTEAPPALASMTNLGDWYRLKFEQTGDEEDLNKAYVWAEQAVECTAENDQELERRQDNLGVILSLL